ncbi:MAG: Gfo/Idh/MocA family oxidoreductase [Phycisphaerales bacterium]|nr:MAG: Gfo/Idh/MocA family oxidoreductase [Phycisphaerales bacterium]
MNRRQFLSGLCDKALAAASLPCVVRSSAWGANGAVPPSERVAMGFIGVGSMGGGHLRTFLGYDDVRVVAVCDLRKMFRQKALERVRQRYGSNGCDAHHDFRELLARDDIDAVTVVTPDHWHGLIAIEAARCGKDMYCEKPLTMCITDSKAVRSAVKRYGVVFQFGAQQRSDEKFRFACELARNEKIGKLHTIMVSSYASITCPNQPNQPTPDKSEFDYDTWLGPAPWAPYTYERCASRAMGTEGMWTHIHDYSLGGLGGAWGIHHVDIAQWGNGTDDTGPIEIQGTGVIPADGLADTAVEWEIEHTYANGVKMIHASTKIAIKRARQFAVRNGPGILFLGTEGWVLVGRGYLEAEPKSLLTATIGPEEIHLPRSNNHRRSFLECVKTRQKTICPVESAVRSDTICHLDDIAIRLGKKLRWDPQKEEFVNDDQANRMLTRAMRSPWRL